MSNIPRKEFVAKVMKYKGEGYIWSEYFKQKTTLATIEATRIKCLSFSGSNPFKSDGNNGRTYAKRCEKWLGKRSGDCSGMIKAAWWERPDGVIAYRYANRPDVNQEGMLKLATVKGNIHDMPDVPGLAVLYPGHVGVYIGNGKVLESRGVNYGVVITNLNDRPWTTYFEIPFVDYSDATGTDGGDTMIKRGDSGAEVYDFQTICMKAGYDIGAWANMNDSSVRDGRDGEFGPHMETVVREIQSEYGLPNTGVVNAGVYGKVALKAVYAHKPEKPETNEPERGKRVVVNGNGWSSSYKSGTRTIEYTDQPMFIVDFIPGRAAPYQLSVDPKMNWTTGFFDDTQVKF